MRVTSQSPGSSFGVPFWMGYAFSSVGWFILVSGLHILEDTQDFGGRLWRPASPLASLHRSEVCSYRRLTICFWRRGGADSSSGTLRFSLPLSWCVFYLAT